MFTKVSQSVLKRCAPAPLVCAVRQARCLSSAVLGGGVSTEPRDGKRYESSMAAQPQMMHRVQYEVPHHAPVHAPAAAAAPKQPTKPKLSDNDVQNALEDGRLKLFDLENQLGDFERAVRMRRGYVERRTNKSMSELPYQDFDYNVVHGACAENVIGYVPIPVGVAGPIVIDGEEFHVPMATTEGALIASTTRGCKAISMSGGCYSEVLRDGISRAPVLQVPSLRVAAELKRYIEDNITEVAAVFNSTSRFARLKDIKTVVAGRYVYLRFSCSSGDAMGMNMVSKGVDKALEHLLAKFPTVEVLGLSGNVCTDKKPSAINWLEGRGKSVVVEATIPGDVVEKVLKTTVEKMVKLNISKNLVGSAVAGSIGGFNAHASNIVTATFLATGQDPAQNVESSNCLTLMEAVNDGKDLYVSVTMPSLEVGTVGGGTILPAQSSCLQMLSAKGSNPAAPGQNAQRLARVIAATVLAGELSLMAALSVGHLISTHLRLNRKPAAPAVAAPAAPADLAAQLNLNGFHTNGHHTNGHHTNGHHHTNGSRNGHTNGSH